MMEPVIDPCAQAIPFERITTVLVERTQHNRLLPCFGWRKRRADQRFEQCFVFLVR